jgi:hypothetical protein
LPFISSSENSNSKSISNNKANSKSNNNSNRNININNIRNIKSKISMHAASIFKEQATSLNQGIGLRKKGSPTSLLNLTY